jgi:hypothetical protein
MLRSSGRRLAVVMCRDLGVPMVYALHRVGSPEMLRLATLALGAASEQSERAEEVRSRLRGAKTQAERDQIEAEVKVAAAEQDERIRAELMADLDRLGSVLSQADALVMAAVVASGVGRTDIELTPGLQPYGTKPGDLCEPLPSPSDASEPTFMRPIEWTTVAPRNEAEEATFLAILDVNETERMELATLVMEAFSPAKQVASFPRGQGSAGDGGQLGAPVRPKAKRARGVR